MNSHADRSRVSGLMAGAAVGLLGLLVGLSIAFASGTQTEQYARDAEVVQQSGTVLTVSAVTQADLGVVLILARSEAGGLEVADLDGAIEKLEATIAALSKEVAAWSLLAETSGPVVAQSLADIEGSLGQTMDAIREGEVTSAEQMAITTVIPSLEDLNQAIAAERDSAAGRLAALRTSAGTLARLASLGVALIIPAVAFFVFRATMRRRQRNAELQLELIQERELVKTKDEFVANLSHELRTPLTGIFGFAMVLDDMLDLGPEHLEFEMLAETTAVILSEASELNRMVDDLLTAAKSDGRPLQLVLEDLEIEPVIESSIDLFRRQGHEIHVRCEPAVVTIDRHHLGQVVRNLVSNATKHGGPSIVIEGRMSADRYAVSVMDDGDGVPDELVERLFSRFLHQGETPLTTGSVGLGLYIAGMLAKAMGGDLSYQRTQGISVFAFTVPANSATDTSQNEAA